MPLDVGHISCPWTAHLGKKVLSQTHVGKFTWEECQPFIYMYMLTLADSEGAEGTFAPPPPPKKKKKPKKKQKKKKKKKKKKRKKKDLKFKPF